MATECRGPVSILLISSDLMVSSRIAGAAAAIPGTVEAIGPAATPRGGPYDVIVVDLQCAGRGAAELVGRAREIAAPRVGGRPAGIVAFGPHVAHERLAEAASAGADLVVSRGELLGALPGIVERVRSSQSRGSTDGSE